MEYFNFHSLFLIKTFNLSTFSTIISMRDFKAHLQKAVTTHFFLNSKRRNPFLVVGHDVTLKTKSPTQTIIKLSVYWRS
jgi:hypothetical protein